MSVSFKPFLAVSLWFFFFAYQQLTEEKGQESEAILRHKQLHEHTIQCLKLLKNKTT